MAGDDGCTLSVTNIHADQATFYVPPSGAAKKSRTSGKVRDLIHRITSNCHVCAGVRFRRRAAGVVIARPPRTAVIPLSSEERASWTNESAAYVRGLSSLRRGVSAHVLHPPRAAISELSWRTRGAAELSAVN